MSIKVNTLFSSLCLACDPPPLQLLKNHPFWSTQTSPLTCMKHMTMTCMSSSREGGICSLGERAPSLCQDCHGTRARCAIPPPQMCSLLTWTKLWSKEQQYSRHWHWENRREMGSSCEEPKADITCSFHCQKGVFCMVGICQLLPSFFNFAIACLPFDGSSLTLTAMQCVLFLKQKNKSNIYHMLERTQTSLPLLNIVSGAFYKNWEFWKLIRDISTRR